MFRILVLSGAILVASPGHAADLERVERVIADPRGLDAPGCAIGAFRGGEPLFITAAGAGDIGSGTPLDGDTLFYAASLSKQFTALAAAILAESGRLDLDQDVRRYLPELPDYGAPVTARMLMNHTAGIRDSLDLIRLAGLGRAAEVDKNTALRLVLEQRGTNFIPGGDYTYSNGGYLLLAEVVERVAGMPFADYARQAILEPLGMTRSFFLNDRPPTGVNIAHGYVPTRTGFDVRDTYPRFSGSGGLMISINDLAKFEHDIEAGHRVWTPAITRVLTTPGVFRDGSPVRDGRNGLGYGGGLMIGHRNGQFFVQHGGAAEAFKNAYARLPERRLAVAVLCNRSDWVAQDKADEIIEAVEGDILTDRKVVEPVLEGRYGSEELQAIYALTPVDGGLDAVISSGHDNGAPRPLRFKRQDDGSYRSSGTQLVFDNDGDAFTLTTSRVRAIRFRRLE